MILLESKRTKFFKVALIVLALEFGLGLLIYQFLSANAGLSPSIAHRDFIAYYAAAELAGEGLGASAYDYDKLRLLQEDIAGETVEGFPWLNPPIYFLFIAPLKTLPLVEAFLLWAAIGLLCGFLVGKIFGLKNSLAVGFILFPMLGVSAGVGQSGGLMALFLGASVATVVRWPLLSGFAFSGMLIKPHIALFVPLVMLATRRWQVIIGMSIGVILLLVTTHLIHGVEPWLSFIAERHNILENLLQSRSPWWKMITPFAMLRSFGISSGVALTVHFIFAPLFLLLTVLVWDTHKSQFNRSLSLTVAALCVTPYSYSYDLAILVVPLAALFGECGGRFPDRGWRVLAALSLWFLPPLLWALQNLFGVILWPLIGLGLLLFYSWSGLRITTR